MRTEPEQSRAIVYRRVSTGPQKEGTSLEAQLEACQRKAQQMGAAIVGDYSDAGISGGLYLARPGLQAALKVLEAGQANTLITANLARCSRDREHQSAIKRRVEEAGARLVFCDVNYDNNATGNLMFSLQGDF